MNICYLQSFRYFIGYRHAVIVLHCKTIASKDLAILLYAVRKDRKPRIAKLVDPCR